MKQTVLCSTLLLVAAAIFAFNSGHILLAGPFQQQGPRDGAQGGHEHGEHMHRGGGLHDEGRQGPPPNPFIDLFDTDQDGEVSAAEIANASAVLTALDANEDGVLSREEFPRPPHPPRHGHGGEERGPHAGGPHGQGGHGHPHDENRAPATRPEFE